MSRRCLSPTRCLGFVLALALLAGCIAPEPAVPLAAGTEALVLTYEIVDLDGAKGPSTAEPGHHCGDARREDGRLIVSLWPDETQPAAPVLAVFPTIPDAWHVGIGGEPFHASAPFTINPGVQDDDTTLGRITIKDGIVHLDGEAVTLPHDWSRHGDGKSWRADLHLAAYEDGVTYERLQGLCD